MSQASVIEDLGAFDPNKHQSQPLFNVLASRANRRAGNSLASSEPIGPAFKSESNYCGPPTPSVADGKVGVVPSTRFSQSFSKSNVVFAVP